MPQLDHCEFRMPSGTPTREGYWFIAARDPTGKIALAPAQVWNHPKYGWVFLMPGDGELHFMEQINPTSWYGELHPHLISTFEG